MKIYFLEYSIYSIPIRTKGKIIEANMKKLSTLAPLNSIKKYQIKNP